MAKGDYQSAIDNYSKSQEPGVADKIKTAQNALQPPAPASPSGTAKPETVAEPSSLFVIKVATFQAISDAEAMLNELKSRNIPSYITGSEGKPYIVFAGKFSSREQAKLTLEQIKKMGDKYRGAFIVERSEERPDFFVVKVATSQSQTEANTILSELKAQGIPAYLAGGQGKPYIVFAGKFATREQAKLNLDKIKQMGDKYRNAFIVERTKD